nr:hypothetical protein [Pseudomonadota bacterium]
MMIFRQGVAVISALFISSLSVAATKNLDIKKYSVTPCEIVLSQNSEEWVNTYTKAFGDTTLERVKGIYRYGVCYDQKLANIEASLRGQGKGPLMGANGDFKDFEAARKAFVNKAMAVCGVDGTYQRIMRANADLYGKQFTYYFYQQYLPKPDLPKVNTAAEIKAQQKLASIIAGMEKSGQD